MISKFGVYTESLFQVSSFTTKSKSNYTKPEYINWN